MINIFLDDEREPSYIKARLGNLYPNDFILIKNYFDFIEIVDKNIGNINLISFDHDIASFSEDKEFTGKDAVNYLIERYSDNNIKLPFWYVHTNNPSGYLNISSILVNYLKHVENTVLDFKYYNYGYIDDQVI